MAASKLLGDLVGKEARIMITGDNYFQFKILCIDKETNFIKLQNKEDEEAKPTWYPLSVIGYIIED